MRLQKKKEYIKEIHARRFLPTVHIKASVRGLCVCMCVYVTM